MGTVMTDPGPIQCPYGHFDQYVLYQIRCVSAKADTTTYWSIPVCIGLYGQPWKKEPHDKIEHKEYKKGKSVCLSAPVEMGSDTLLSPLF